VAHLIDTRFVLAVKDLAISTAYYRDMLGLAIDFEVPGWSFMSRDRFRVMLGECADAMAAGETGDHSWYAYVTVDDATALYEEYRAKGFRDLRPIADKPWGMREFALTTPDGHRITFGQEIR
jgi:catechol 2,3-dioxygenase-like lactoylglutathione lyase family enzyme